MDYPGRFARDCGEGEFLAGAGRILVACSGGADSTALALLLSGYLDALGDASPRLYIGHVNHALRGSASDRDESFTRELARELGAKFLSVRLPATSEAQPLSEGRARELRYEVFGQWAAEHRLDRIATAHHRDDQQETLLLRLCRGTGIAGLAGIPASRPLDGEEASPRLVRPLLGWSRAELLDYLESRGRSFRIDRTNDSLEIPRNRVRHEVLPLLEEHVHPGVRSSLSHLAGQAAELQGDLEALGRRALAASRLVDSAAGEISLSREALLCWPPSVRREVYAAVARELRPGAGGFFTRRELESVEDVLDPGDAIARADLGGGLRVGRVRERLEFGLGDAAGGLREEVPRQEVLLQVDGEPAVWGGWSLSARREPWRGPGGDSVEEWIDEASLGEGLLVRGRLPGDRVWPLGAPGSKKLKEFMRESGVPSGGRDGVPLVVSGDKIVWVVGQRLCQPFSVPAGGAPAVRLRACRLEEAS